MKKKLKICYFGKFEDNKYADTHEKEIGKALKNLGYTVYELDEAKTTVKELLEKANKSDLFLFHNGGVETIDTTTFYMGLSGLISLLRQIKCPKVFWFKDRVLGLGEVWADMILKEVNFGFFNDDTWVRRHKYTNAYGLHLGTSERPQGEPREDYKCDIAFVGRVYEGRKEIIELLKQQYGLKFKVFDNVWGKDFDDLMQSVKIFIQPKWLQNDFLWTDNIYRIMGGGGFILHPRLYGLKEEGFEDGTNFVGYTELTELLAEIDFFLKPENIKIRESLIKNSKEFVLANCTWEKRLEKMMKIIKDNLLQK